MWTSLVGDILRLSLERRALVLWMLRIKGVMRLALMILLSLWLPMLLLRTMRILLLAMTVLILVSLGRLLVLLRRVPPIWLAFSRVLYIAAVLGGGGRVGL